MTMDRATFEAVADEVGGGVGVPVMLEDSRMGLIAHWSDEGAQIEAYRGNDHECIQVPWKNLIKTPMGIVVGLKGALRNADYGLSEADTSDKPERVTHHLPHSDWHVIRSISVENRGDDIAIDCVGKPREYIPGIREMVLTINGEFPANNIDIVEVNGIRFKREPD